MGNRYGFGKSVTLDLDDAITKVTTELQKSETRDAVSVVCAQGPGPSRGIGVGLCRGRPARKLDGNQLA